jgi:hypothetical protein
MGSTQSTNFKIMEWIDVKKQKPEVNTKVLIFADMEIGVGELKENGTWQESQNWTLVTGDWGHYDNDTEIEEYQITHWMELPKTPIG